MIVLQSTRVCWFVPKSTTMPQYQSLAVVTNKKIGLKSILRTLPFTLGSTSQSRPVYPTYKLRTVLFSLLVSVTNRAYALDMSTTFNIIIRCSTLSRSKKALIVLSKKHIIMLK